MKRLHWYRILRWREGSRANQYIMAFFVTIPTMSLGMVLGWMSPAIPLLQSDDGPLDKQLTQDELSWMASVVFLTSIPCMLAAGTVADLIGRKLTTIITSFSLIVCWLVKLCWIQSETLILARAIAGVANAGCFVITPLYLKEISDDDIRGTIGSFLILSQNVGFLAMYIIGDLLPFKTVLCIAFVIPLVHFVMFMTMPDTPSFLVKKGKIKEATEVLAWLRSVNIDNKVLLDDIRKLEAEEKMYESNNQRAKWKILLKDATTRSAFITCTVLLLSQEFCGYLVLLTYASDVFAHADVGSALSPNQEVIVLGVVQLAGSVVASYLVERIGRKPLLIVSSFSTGVGMLSLGVWFFTHARGLWAPGWLPVAAMCLSIFSTSAGFQPIPFVIMSELFSFQLRGFVTSIVVGLASFADFAQTETYEMLITSIGPHGTFWMFAMICFFASVCALLFMPETRGKSLAEIYDDMEDSRWRKKKTVQITAL